MQKRSMPKELAKNLFGIGNGRISRANPAYLLRTQLWIKTLLRETGLTEEEFWRTYVQPANYPRKTNRQTRSSEAAEYTDNTGIVRRWMTNIQVSKVTALAVSDELSETVPDADALFILPIFELLNEVPLSIKEVEALSAPFLSSEHKQKRCWKFPSLTVNQEWDVILDHDTHALLRRGDLYGLMGLLANARWCEAAKASKEHVQAIADLYRILPLIARTKWFKEGWSELLPFVAACHANKHTLSHRIIACDVSKLTKAVGDPGYLEKLNEESDPIVYATFPEDRNLLRAEKMMFDFNRHK